MDLSNYLLVTGRITQEEYNWLIKQQHHLHAMKDHAWKLPYSTYHEIRPTPAGEALKHLPRYKDILNKSSSPTLDGLLNDWCKWHVSNLEPMSTYSLSSPFGRQLFVCEHEKKAVARYVTHEPVWRNQPLIRDHDVVILTEGTSCFYVGLAIAAHRKGVKILSSNGGLIREYNENPHFRSSLADFQSIGGNIDWENRGCVGTLSQEQYIKAVTSGEPRTSVLVCDVSGLLPEDGPYNPTPQTATDRLALLEEALDHDVRHIVFVADHAKHLDSNRGTYGANVFAEQNWHDLMNGQKVKKQGDRKINPEGKIFIVTSPPPDLQKHILTHPADRDVVKRDFRFHQNVALSKGETAEYERSAQGFTKNFKVWKESKLFHEALCEPVQSASLSVK